MDHAAAMQVLDGFQRHGMRFRLGAMETLLAKLGNPERELRVLHVGGTNGKGSVCAMLTSTMSAAGLRVGTYTSPHLVAFEERIALQGQPIPPATTAALVEACLPAFEAAAHAGLEPTYFEAGTAMALHHFAAARVDVAVVEVGLGGKLDATNVFDAPLAAVVTNVGLDHTDILGGTVEAIAGDKAHIAKPGRPLVTAAGGPALDVVRRVATERGARVRTLEGMAWERRAANAERQAFALRSPGRDHGALALPLLGDHQLRNAAVAVATLEEVAADGVEVPAAALRRGLAGARIPGRWQRIATTPDVVLDGAHNPDAARALAAHVQALRARRGGPASVALVLGVLADKDVHGIAAALAPAADLVVATQPPGPRALPAGHLAAAVGGHARRVEAEPAPAAAVERAVRATPRDGLVLVTGSLYLVGAVLASRAFQGGPAAGAATRTGAQSS